MASGYRWLTRIGCWRRPLLLKSAPPRSAPMPAPLRAPVRGQGQYRCRRSADDRGLSRFRRFAVRSAPVVERLIAAGALLIGKTNLDQFATGLVGTRSPYGVPRNPFDPAYIPGGSSSGSAVAVGAGLVAFALGTDTAGSGRVPAGFNNIVGLKPTRGLISAAGVVPACRSLDCVSIFALTVQDAAAVHEVAWALDPGDPYSRRAPAGFGAFGAMPPRFAFGVLPDSEREFFGDEDGPALYKAAIARFVRIGGEAVTIDFAPFRDAASLVYRGAWLAERLAAIDDAVGGCREMLLPVTREIIERGDTIRGAGVFRDFDRLMAARGEVAAVWRQIDLLLVPTTGTTYRITEIEANPVAPQRKPRAVHQFRQSARLGCRRVSERLPAKRAAGRSDPCGAGIPRPAARGDRRTLSTRNRPAARSYRGAVAAA